MASISINYVGKVRYDYDRQGWYFLNEQWLWEELEPKRLREAQDYAATYADAS